MKRAFSWIMFALLLIGIFEAAFRVQPVKASGTIYIMADGSIDPLDAPISTVDNVTYTLTGNITSDADGIVVERDNIIIDGVGYTVEGTGSWDYKGIGLEAQNNVTITNISINGFYYGIWLQDSSNNNLFGNNITDNNSYGIYLQDSSKNMLRNNNMTDNRDNFWVGGFSLLDYVNDVDSSNTVKPQPLYYWVNRTDETIPLDAGYVALINCTRIAVQNLNLEGNGDGILLAYTTDSKITKNNLTDACGIYVWYSSDFNNISGNNVKDSVYGIYLYGSSNHNWISDNNIKNSSYGLWLLASYQNSIIGNNITTNTRFGIRLEYSMGNNIYHNNFIDNVIQVSTDSSGYANVWDDGYPSGGNYWSDYTGSDFSQGLDQNTSGSDGIGDSRYGVNANLFTPPELVQFDNYPLMGQFSDFNPTSEHHAQIICNSTISDFQFNETAISFYVSGENGTAGFCRICIPTALMNATYRVFVNGTEVQHTLLPCSNSTYSYLYFNYAHSTQEVVIIPEFPLFLILPLFMIATLLAVIVYRRCSKIAVA